MPSPALVSVLAGLRWSLFSILPHPPPGKVRKWSNTPTGASTNPKNFDLPCFPLVGYFLTFLGGVGVGEVGQIKIKDHLSPAEAKTGAELGKNHQK